MPFWRFTALTALGCIPWVLALALIGQAVGENWEDWRDKLHYLDYVVIVLILAAIAWLIIRRRRGGDGDEQAAAGPAG
jgi:membrane protein DedA with SNARE-associated domain